jgi:glycosyltransferase involved in cell wall biosynthesis
MTNNPVARVSVCLPTIDRPAFLREAIASVVAQTWTDYEIVLADNSADPGAQGRIDEVIAQFPGINLTVHRHATQLGSSENFNSLIEAARGEFCVFLPDDDRICPEFLEHAVGALDRNPQCSFTFGDHWIMRPDGTRDMEHTLRISAQYGRDALREGVYPFDQLYGLVLGQSICLQTVLFRRPVLDKFRFVPGVIAGDQSLFLQISAAETPLHAYYLAERVCEYRVHGHQVTSLTPREEMVRDQIFLLEGIHSIPPAHVDKVRTKLGQQYLALAFLEAERGANRDAREHAIKSIRLAVDLRSVLGTLLVTAAPSAIRTVRRFTNVVRDLI